MKASLTLWFHSDPLVFGAIRRLVAQIVMLSGGSADDATQLEVATGEVLTNAYQHAYRKSHGPLQIDLTCDDRKVEVSIHDDGELVIDVPKIPATPAEARGRRGLYIVGIMTDHAEIVHPRNAQGGTAVKMIKYMSTTNWLSKITGIDTDCGGQVGR